MQHIAKLLDIPGQAGPPSPAYTAGGLYNRNISGRGSRENRPLFNTGRVPGFATPRRESTPSDSSTSMASTSRLRDSPGRLIDQKRSEKNGPTKSRDNSSNRNRSRDGSPRMPRPRSEEIPLELIKKPANAPTEISPKISILPRPQTSRIEQECPVTSTTTTPEATTATLSLTKSEETSFIASQLQQQQLEKKTTRRKGAIETV